MESFSATIQHGHHKPTVERRGKIGGWGWGGTLALGVGSGQTSDTRCLYSRDNIAEHSALFTFSHLMQSEGPFHDKRSPFFSESPNTWYRWSPVQCSVSPFWKSELKYLSSSSLIFHTTSSIGAFDWNCILNIFLKLKQRFCFWATVFSARRKQCCTHKGTFSPPNKTKSVPFQLS